MTGILFIARLGSTRLSNKHLIEVNGKSFVEWLVTRYTFEFKKEIENGKVKLFLATSNMPENKKFETVLNNLPITIFYGDDQNIPLRQTECAEKYMLKNIISIDGDDILCSTKAARNTYNQLIENINPFVKTTGLAFGMNVVGYTSDFLKKKVSQISGKLETGWGRIFENEPIYEINMGTNSENKDLRLTLDYDLDAEFFKAVISYCGNSIVALNDDDLINLILEKQFFKINKSLHDQYWANFNKQKNNEL